MPHSDMWTFPPHAGAEGFYAATADQYAGYVSLQDGSRVSQQGGVRAALNLYCRLSSR